MKSVAVLGSGRMGMTIAEDLSPDYSVTLIDSNREALEHVRRDRTDVKIKQAEVTKDLDGIEELLQAQDLVIGALPGLIGFSILESLVRLRRPTVDISFFPENPAPLSLLANQEGVAVAVDCGLAPGLCNLLLGRHLSEMQVLEYQCLVGGLPAQRTLPFQYKAPFSPRDVIEEYTRPVRLRRKGKEMTLAPLSEPELVEFSEVGTLEAFNTDGLRTLLDTTGIPTLAEKTLRYPGHRDQIEFLRQAGFLSPVNKTIGRCKISPLEMTARILEAAWSFGPGEPDLTLMRVEVSGIEAGENRTYRYELIDRFDPDTCKSSMSRTTGFTCAAVARLMLQEQLIEPGLWTPELIGQNSAFAEFILEYLAKRDVKVKGGRRSR